MMKLEEWHTVVYNLPYPDRYIENSQAYVIQTPFTDHLNDIIEVYTVYDHEHCTVQLTDDGYLYNEMEDYEVLELPLVNQLARNFGVVVDKSRGEFTGTVTEIEQFNLYFYRYVQFYIQMNVLIETSRMRR